MNEEKKEGQCIGAKRETSIGKNIIREVGGITTWI